MIPALRDRNAQPILPSAEGGENKSAREFFVEGSFKPRTSPYGLRRFGEEGLKIFWWKFAKNLGLRIVASRWTRQTPKQRKESDLV